MNIEEIRKLSESVARHPIQMPWHPMGTLSALASQVVSEVKNPEAIDWNLVERRFIPSHYAFNPNSLEPSVRALNTIRFWQHLDNHPNYDMAHMSADIAAALEGLAYLATKSEWNGFLGTSWTEVKDSIIAAYVDRGAPLDV